jgi:hypothetical protein
VRSGSCEWTAVTGWVALVLGMVEARGCGLDPAHPARATAATAVVAAIRRWRTLVGRRVVAGGCRGYTVVGCVRESDPGASAFS